MQGLTVSNNIITTITLILALVRLTIIRERVWIN